MNPEQQDRGAPSDETDGIDCRAVFYGNLLGASSFSGGPVLDQGPPHMVREFSSAKDSESTVWGRGTSESMWSNTHYGEWLSASVSSLRRPLLPEGVQRIGDVHRIRGKASYSGPSGLSQSRKPTGVREAAPFASDVGEGYFGAVAQEPYVREPPVGLQADIYGRPRSSYGREGGLSFGTNDAATTANGGVYMLAPDADPCGIGGKATILLSGVRQC